MKLFLMTHPGAVMGAILLALFFGAEFINEWRSAHRGWRDNG